MAKLTLSDLANLQNENSAVATLKANNDATELAMEKTLSRDGTSPNQMEADFDMNSFRIMNLPKAVNADEPLRLQDLSDFYNTGTVSNIPAGGNEGDVLAKTSDTDYEFDWVADSTLITAGDNIVKSGTSPVTIATSLTPTFTSVNGLTISTSTGTLTIADGKTATISNTLTFTSTDGSTAAFGAGGTVAYKGSSLAQFAATTSAELAGVISDETGSGALVFGTSPSLTTPHFSSIVNTGTITLPTSTDTLVGRATTDTLTNKSINLSSNTLTGTTAQFNTALSDDNFVTLTANQTLTNKTLTAPIISTIVNTGTLTLPTSTDTLVGRATTDTLTNKSISGSSNTLTSIANSSLVNSSITVAGHAVSLGGSTAIAIGDLSAINNNTIVANVSGASAVPAAKTITQVLDGTVSSTQGSILYRNSTSWVALAPGTSGNFLKTQGSAANPIWDSIPGGGDMLAANNLSDVADVATARENLGLFGIVFAHQYGVVGDGSTDDTSALQDFFDALQASPYLAGWLIGSSGVFFKTTSALSIGSGVKVMGCGWNTEIRPTHNGQAIKTKGTSTVGANAIFLSDFAIVGKTAAITGISKANPAVVTCSGGHSFANGDTVRLPNVLGMTQVAGNNYTVAGATSTTFQLSGVDSSAYTTYTSGGDVVYSTATAVDLRYASNCRLNSIKAQGFNTAFFKYTDSGTVGCYYNRLNDCLATSCEIGDQNYTGANSNSSKDFQANNCRFPVWDVGNANRYGVLTAEQFSVAVTAVSGSADSVFEIVRAENTTAVGTVFSIGSGVTGAKIPTKPHIVNVPTTLSDSGTGTLYYARAISKAWGVVTQSGGTYTLGDHYGVTSISKTSTGIIVVTLQTAFSTTAYTVVPSLSQTTAATVQEAGGNRTTTTFEIRIQSVGATPALMDSGFSFTVFGNQ